VRLAFFAAVAITFALGVLLRDIAQDSIAEPKPSFKLDKQNAEYAKALVYLLNEKTVELQGATISCRVTHHEEKQ
jgi:hypothetical protein